MANLFKVIYIVNAIPTKFPLPFITEIETKSLKIHKVVPKLLDQQSHPE